MKPTLVEYAPPAALGCLVFISLQGILPSCFFGRGVLWAAFIAGLLSAVFGLPGIAGPKKGKRRRTSAEKNGHTKDSAKTNANKRTGFGLRFGTPHGLFLFLPFALSGFFFSFTAKSVFLYLDAYAHAGLPADAVEAAEIVLTEDPRIRGEKGWTAEGRLIGVSAEGVSTQAQGRILVFASGEPSSLAAGRKVLLHGRMESGNLNEIPFVFFAESWELKEWLSTIFSFRLSFTETLQAKFDCCKPDTSSFFSALILGKKTDSGSPLMMRFEASGCMHLLALSGFHVGLMAMIIRRMLKPAGLVVSFSVSAAASLAYLFLVGLRPSLIRAVVMFCLWAYDRSRGFRSRPICYLSGAFLLQCLFFPHTTSSLAFQLSYAALAGMLSAGKAAANGLTRIRLRLLGAVAGSGIGAHASTMPFVVSAFGIWRPVGLAAAPVLTPLTALSMASGALLLILPKDTAVFNAAVFCSDGLIGVIEAAAGFFSFVRGVPVPLPVAWLLMLGGVTIPLFQLRRSENVSNGTIEPRLPGLNSIFPGEEGNRSEETLGAEFSHQSRSQGKNHRTAGRSSRHDYLGNRSRIRSHERIPSGTRGEADGF